MKYLLHLPTASDSPELEIEEENYRALMEAKKVLFNCLSIEKKYEILLSNYLEFEQEILRVTTSQMIRQFPSSNYDAYRMIDLDVRLMIDLRLVNLLTSARLYLDHLSGHMRECLPHKSDTKSVINSLRSAEFESKVEYKFMEELRNHVQHRGLAVHVVRLPKRWRDFGEERLLEFSLGILSQKSELESDEGFKKQVLDEIPDEVDLKLFTRSYIESFSNIHLEIRKQIADSVAQSRRKIEEAFCRYQKEYNREVKLLEVLNVDGGQIVKSESLLLERDNIRRKLEERNGSLLNLHKRFVTNK